jgi:hypothetical protein
MPRHPPCALELLLLAWLAQIPFHRQWQLQGPGITSLSPSQVLLDYLSLIVTSLQLTTTTSKNTDRPARTARPVSHHPGNPTPAPAPPITQGAASWYYPSPQQPSILTTSLRGATGTPRPLSGQASRPRLSGATGTRTPDPLLAKQVL